MNASLLLAPLLALSAGAGNEVVLVLDNSCSMIIQNKDSTGKPYPANDPERAAVLGALVVEGLTRGTDDKFSLIAFGPNAAAAPHVVTTADDIRHVPYVNGTFFKNSLMEARRKLESSTLEKRLFLFFTDGAPEDLATPDEGPKLLALEQQPQVETLIVGLYGSPEAQKFGEIFLRPMARAPDDLVFVYRPHEVVAAFTRGYARVLGSRPETGTLNPGGTKQVDVGKYVVEVMVAVASSQPGAPFTSKLTGPQGAVTPRATGDNACQPGLMISNAPTVCKAPYRNYQVFRAQNDPTRASKWTLTLPTAPGSVDYGIILRYDLTAALKVPSPVRVGEPQKVEANLVFRGQPFVDEAFFKSDGFTAKVVVAGKELELKHAGGGKFVADWLPDVPTGEKPGLAQVTFRNNWMEKSARQPVTVEGFLDLDLHPAPNPIELGTWRGEREETRKCQVLDLSGSRNAEAVPIGCTTQGTLAQGGISCLPVPGSEGKLKDGSKGQPMKWEVCVTAAACCKEMAPADLAVRMVGTHKHYEPGAVVVPVHLKVEETGFLRCYWVYIAIAIGTLVALFLIIGFTRPYSFDAAATVTVAGSEMGLKRSSAQVLRELPGGRRGFYRHAKICLNGTGDFVRKPNLAVVVLEAGPANTTRFKRASGLERKVARTGKWEPVTPQDLALGYNPGTIYRSGTLFMKFG